MARHAIGGPNAEKNPELISQELNWMVIRTAAIFAVIVRWLRSGETASLVLLVFGKVNAVSERPVARAASRDRQKPGPSDSHDPQFTS
jgi:hypothetical protein